MRKRDNQRSAVYKWEASLLEWAISEATTLTVTEAQQLVNKVWKQYGPADLSPPTVKDRPRAQRGMYYFASRIIAIPECARHKMYVLHEVAHALTPGEHHNPPFVKVLIELYTQYANVNPKKAKQLADTQKPRRVKYA